MLATRIPPILSAALSYRDGGFESMEDYLEQHLAELYREGILGDESNCEAVVFYYKM